MTVTRGAPHYLLSDAAPLSLRRTRAGAFSLADAITVDQLKAATTGAADAGLAP